MKQKHSCWMFFFRETESDGCWQVTHRLISLVAFFLIANGKNLRSKGSLWECFSGLFFCWWFFLCRHSQASLKAKSFSMTLTFNFTLSPNLDQCLQRSVSLNWQIWWTTLSLGCEMVFDLLIFSHIWGFKLFKRNKKDAGLRPYVS